MAATHITPLENFVKSFNRQHRKTAFSKQAVQKAIVLIDIKLDPLCCRVVQEVDLITTKKSMFISTLEQFLKNMELQGNKHSLLRTKSILQKSIGIPCCQIV